jgi:anti-sigma factor RsiW
MSVTRPIILDLWPAYVSGEASAETRALVDEFLRQDPEFARQLRANPLADVATPPLPPDLETNALARARRQLRGFPWLLKLATLFSALAFARIVSDTSWDVSPRNFIVTASIAAAFWTAFLVSLWRMRARILIVSDRKTPDRRGA